MKNKIQSSEKPIFKPSINYYLLLNVLSIDCLGTIYNKTSFFPHYISFIQNSNF